MEPQINITCHRPKDECCNRGRFCKILVLAILITLFAFTLGLILGAIFAETIFAALAAIIVLAIILLILILIKIIMLLCERRR